MQESKSSHANAACLSLGSPLTVTTADSAGVQGLGCGSLLTAYWRYYAHPRIRRKANGPGISARLVHPIHLCVLLRSRAMILVRQVLLYGGSPPRAVKSQSQTRGGLIRIKGWSDWIHHPRGKQQPDQVVQLPPGASRDCLSCSLLFPLATARAAAMRAAFPGDSVPPMPPEAASP